MPNRTSQTPNRTISRILLRYGILVGIYLLLILVSPGSQPVMSTHNLSLAEYRILQLMVGLPLVLVWGVCFYGYAKLVEYAYTIRQSSEASGFMQLAQGCAWIAWSLPIHSIVTLAMRMITNIHPGFNSAAVIIINYIDLLFPLVAFSLIGSAARQLFSHTRLALSTASIRGITLVFVAGGVFYCYLIFKQFSGTNLGSTDNPYCLPVWLMVTTVIVPYLYAWFVGLLGIYELITYGRHVRGVLYRQAMQLLVVGLLATVIGSIASQYSRSAQPQSSHLLLDPHLVFIILFQILTGVGFILIAAGAHRLKKMEEV